MPYRGKKADNTLILYRFCLNSSNIIIQWYKLRMDLLFHLDFWMSLLVLTLLEIVLNADNIIFIVSASSRLPREQQALARKLGLLVAAGSRIAFLSLLVFATTFTQALFYIGDHNVSINDIVLVLGGAFLIINPFMEIYELRAMKEANKLKSYAKLGAVILQIMFIDIVFSIDNVVTAIGVAQTYLAMVGAILIAMIFMLIASNFLSRLVDAYPKLKIIGLSYLVLIGLVLVARGFGFDVPSAYIYLPLGFVVFTQAMLIYTRTD